MIVCGRKFNFSVDSEITGSVTCGRVMLGSIIQCNDCKKRQRAEITALTGKDSRGEK